MKIIASIKLLLALLLLTAPAAGAASDEEIVVIRAGKIITGTGTELAGGMIVIIDGRIEHVGGNVTIPTGATVVDASEHVVMPSLVHARTRVGLSNFGRSGTRSNLNVTPEVYLETISFDNLLHNGFTTAAFYPPGTGIPGRASIYHTVARNGEQLVKADAYLRMTLTNAGRDKRPMREAFAKAKEELQKIATAREEWEKKQQEAQNQSNGNAEPEPFRPPAIDESVRGVMDLIEKKGEIVALFELGGASDLLHLFDVIEPDFKDVPHIIYYSGNTRDLHYVVEELGSRGSLVLMSPALPAYPNSAQWYNSAAMLVEHGAEIAFVPPSDNAAGLSGYRNRVADLVRAGLSRDTAIRAMTLNPARVLRMDDKIGSLEAGKWADVMILDGDPLDGHSEVTQVLLRGRTVWKQQ